MINTIEVASRSREHVTHQLFLDEQGKAIGCTCEFRQYQSFKACTHMKTWNTQVEAITTIDLVAHVEDDLRSQYEGCQYCGKNHKSWNCPF